MIAVKYVNSVLLLSLVVILPSCYNFGEIEGFSCDSVSKILAVAGHAHTASNKLLNRGRGDSVAFIVVYTSWIARFRAAANSGVVIIISTSFTRLVILS